MGGSNTNEERSEFLSRLLDRAVDWRDDLKLTSGQKARYFAWCDENRIEYQLGPSTSTSNMPTASSDDNVDTNADSNPRRAIDKMVGPTGGVGVDIQQISELFPQDLTTPKADKSLTSIFTLKELSYAESSSDIRQTLTGIFASKEAIIKASAEYKEKNLPDIEIIHNPNGAPTHEEFRLSISHSGNYAVAVAIYNKATNSQVSNQEFDQHKDLLTKDVKKMSNFNKPTTSKMSRTMLRAKRLILFLGTIGGLWVLIEKIYYLNF